MLDQDTSAWLRTSLAQNESRAVERLQRDLRAAQVVLVGRHAAAVVQVKVRTLDGGVLRFKRDGGRIEYFPNWRNNKLDRHWHDAAEMSDWWALRDAAAEVERLCDAHLKAMRAAEAQSAQGGGE